MDAVSAKFDSRRSPLADIGAAGSEYLSAPQPESMIAMDGIDEKRLRPLAQDEHCLWIGPDKWLVVSENLPPRDLWHKLATAAQETALTDVSHGMFRIRLTGPRSREILSAGVRIDLHPPAFPVNKSTPTAYRDVYVVLHAVNQDILDLYTLRSYAASLWEMLLDTADLLEALEPIMNFSNPSTFYSNHISRTLSHDSKIEKLPCFNKKI